MILYLTNKHNTDRLIEVDISKVDKRYVEVRSHICFENFMWWFVTNTKTDLYSTPQSAIIDDFTRASEFRGLWWEIIQPKIKDLDLNEQWITAVQIFRTELEILAEKYGLSFNTD